MANPTYTRLQATAQRLIQKFGQSGSVKRITPPDDELGGANTETSYAAVLVPITYKQADIDGTRIRDGDVQIYISSVGLGITPSAGDIVVVNGAEFAVIAAQPNNYDGKVAVVFVVQGRLIA